VAGVQKLVILGTGGNGVDVLDLVHDLNTAGAEVRYECVAFLDDNRALWGTALQGVPVVGPLAASADMVDCRFINTIGSPGSYWRKGAILGATGLPPSRFVTLIHPSAAVSRTARLGAGVVVFPHVTIGSNARVGAHVCLLPNAVVSHDVVIGDYTCVAGGVCISGGARIGSRAYLGTASSVIGGVEVGDGSLVGMGSVVIRRVPPNVVVAGNPARFLRHIVTDDAAAPA
jgi:sugar O-acyltransferase (sialic acid O-acetyltransferase NeuD family)